MKQLHELNVKIFADGADRARMLEMYRDPLIQGFTTNPTLMRKSGVTDYEEFARQVLADIPDRPVSFEVVSDEFEEMEEQARQMARWGDNLYVKIPVCNTRGRSTAPLIRSLARSGVKLNVTAVFTLEQVHEVAQALGAHAPAVISVFAGRIADTGRDPMPLMAAARALIDSSPNIELLWASPRELLNIFQADATSCHIITVANDLLKKLNCVGKDLEEFSLETVKMFYNDALKARYTIGDGRLQRAAA
jgi:transaldolase